MTNRLIIIGGSILIAIILVLFSCQAIRQRQAEATEKRVERAQSSATTESAREAIKTQGEASARERASDELSRTNSEEIRNAKGASDPVGPAVRDAGFASLCRRDSFRRTARGRVQCADPADVGAGR